MLLLTILLALAAGSALGFPQPQLPLPARYNKSLAGATFLMSNENGGIATPPDQYENIEIQAIDGKLVFTQNPPTRICPCSDTFGAKNFTGYYVGGTNAAPTLQLDLSLQYTFPGAPIPSGANMTSIYLFDPEALGGGLPSGSVANVQGFVTAFDGTRTYYNGLQLCAAPDSPPRTEDGVGPLKILATRAEGNTPDGSGIVDAHCIDGAIFNTINDPKVAPYDISFRTPSEPLAFAYQGGDGL